MGGFRLDLYPKGVHAAKTGFCSAFVKVPKAGKYSFDITIAGKTRELTEIFKDRLIMGWYEAAAIPSDFGEMLLKYRSYQDQLETREGGNCIAWLPAIAMGSKEFSKD